MSCFFSTILSIAIVSVSTDLISKWNIDDSSGNLVFGFDSGCIISIHEKHTNQQTIYTFGGKSNQAINTIQKWAISSSSNFEQISNTWTNSSISPFPFTCHQSIAYNTNNNIIYLSGIQIQQPQSTKYRHIYTFDPNTNKFRNNNIPTIPIPVHSSCIAMDNMNNLLYIIGGKQSEAITINALQILDIASSQWLPFIANAPINISSSSCYISPQTQSFYVFGGTNSDKILRYKTKTNKWQHMGKLTQTKHDMSIIETDNNKLLLIGGIIMNDSFTNEIEVFDISNPGNTILDKPIHDNDNNNISINGKVMAIIKNSSVVIWGLINDTTNECMTQCIVSNKITESMTWITVTESNNNIINISHNFTLTNVHLLAILGSISMIGLSCCISSILCCCLVKTNQDLNAMVKNDIQNIRKIQNLHHIKIKNLPSAPVAPMAAKQEDVCQLSNNKLPVNPDIFKIVSTEMDQFISENVDELNEHDILVFNDNAMSPSEGIHRTNDKLALPEKPTNNRNNKLCRKINNIHNCNKNKQRIVIDLQPKYDPNLMQIIYNNYIKMYDYKPKEAKHLIAFAIRNGIKIKYLDAKDIIRHNDNNKMNTNHIQIIENSMNSTNSMLSVSEVQYEGIRVKHRKNDEKMFAISPSFTEKSIHNSDRYFTNSVNNIAK